MEEFKMNPRQNYLAIDKSVYTRIGVVGFDVRTLTEQEFPDRCWIIRFSDEEDAHSYRISEKELKRYYYLVKLEGSND